MAIRNGVIAVLGPKGGVGKTTIATNLAIGLARKHQVALVDGYVMNGDVSIFLNLRAPITLDDLVSSSDPLDEDYVLSASVKHESGVSVLTTKSVVSNFPPDTGRRLFDIIQIVSERFRYVVVDTPPMVARTPDLSACIQAADLIVAVTTPTLPALKGLRTLLGSLSESGWDYSRFVLVLNGVSERDVITTDQIQGFLKVPIAVKIPQDLDADEAISKVKPLITGESLVAAALNELVALVSV